MSGAGVGSALSTLVLRRGARSHVPERSSRDHGSFRVEPENAAARTVALARLPDRDALAIDARLLWGLAIPQLLVDRISPPKVARERHPQHREQRNGPNQAALRHDPNPPPSARGRGTI